MKQDMGHYPKVSIIILNWNGWKDTIECLESVYQIDYPNFDVVVVDNGSTDGSVEKIKKYCNGDIKIGSKFFKYNKKNKPIKIFEIHENEAKRGKFIKKTLYKKYDVNRRMIIIKNRENYGFAEGNNIGIKFILDTLNPDYILLLNNDIVVLPDFLTKLVKAAEKDNMTGVLAPIVKYYHNPENIQSPTRIPKSDNREIPSTHSSVYGMCILLRSEILRDVGLFDIHYFMYYEEYDLLFRVQNRGYKITAILTSEVYHKGVVNIKKSFSKNRQYRMCYYRTRNYIYFTIKYRHKFGYPKLFIKIINAMAYILLFAAIHANDPQIAIARIIGFIDGIKHNLGKKL